MATRTIYKDLIVNANGVAKPLPVCARAGGGFIPNGVSANATYSTSTAISSEHMFRTVFADTSGGALNLTLPSVAGVVAILTQHTGGYHDDGPVFSWFWSIATSTNQVTLLAGAGWTIAGNSTPLEARKGATYRIDLNPGASTATLTLVTSNAAAVVV